MSADGGGRRSEAASRSVPSDGPALAALLALLFVPWTVLLGDGVTLVAPWGLVEVPSGTAVDLYSYLFRYTAGLPEFLLAWPLSALLYAAALASATVGVAVGREDPRVTFASLVLVGVVHLSVARGLAVQPGRSAYPIGSLALWAVAWWVYWPRVRS